MSIRAATDPSTLATSSTLKIVVMKLHPEPPYFSGISIPIKPFSKSFRINPSSILLSFSILRTSGAISSFANLLTLSFIKISSSVNWDKGPGL